MRENKLSGVQMQRLSAKSDAACKALEKLHHARIYGTPRQVIKAQADYDQADRSFQRAVGAGGLQVGDTIRVVVDGPYKGKVAEIDLIEFDGRLKVDIDGRSVLPWASQVEIIV